MTFPTASGMLMIRTLHSLSYKVLIGYTEAAARVHVGRIFLHTSLFIPSLETVVNTLLDDYGVVFSDMVFVSAR